MIEVVVSEREAMANGLGVGDSFVAFNPRSPASQPQSFTVLITAIWRPIDAEDDY